MATQTSVARLSLASGSEPATRTDHSIKIRARTTGGQGTMRAALYEGANNRSGDLESSALTTSLADYTLEIPDANAEDITSYTDLEIRLWGYVAADAADPHGRLSGPQQLTGTAATQFTAGPGGARIETIYVSNPFGSPVDFTLSIGTDAAGTRLYDDWPIPADTEWFQHMYLVVNEDEIVQAFASIGGVLVLTIAGTNLGTPDPVVFEVDQVYLETPAA